MQNSKTGVTIMSSVKDAIPALLSDKLKAMLRSFRRISKRNVFDKPSALEIGTFDGFEVAHRIGTADEEQIAQSFAHDVFFAGIPEYQPEDGHVIIDIGAHIGTFSLLASSKKATKVYAIEACKDSFNLLRINISLNKTTNISAHHLAITDRNGTCTLYYDEGTWGHSITKAVSRRSETVESCTLTDFLERNKIAQCHFMKLNCEGAEFPILLSTAPGVLARFNAILVLYHCDLWAGNTEKDLLSHFKSSGFNAILRNATEKRGWIIALNNKFSDIPG